MPLVLTTYGTYLISNEINSYLEGKDAKQKYFKNFVLRDTWLVNARSEFNDACAEEAELYNVPVSDISKLDNYFNLPGRMFGGVGVITFSEPQELRDFVSYLQSFHQVEKGNFKLKVSLLSSVEIPDYQVLFFKTFLNEIMIERNTTEFISEIDC